MYLKIPKYTQFQLINMDDKKLLEKLSLQDERTLHYFIRIYERQIIGFIEKKVNDRCLAEEITQDVFIDFIEHIRSFQMKCSIRTFLMTIAKNKVIDYYKKKKLKKILFSALPVHVVNAFSTIFNDEIERNELKDKIASVLKKLPNDYALILRLKYMEGEKLISIASSMMLSFKAAESLLYRARKAFMKQFSYI